MQADQFADLSSAFADFEHFGIPNTAGGRDPQNCIFYRRDEFTKVAAGGYWLSETPHVAGSKSWDSAYIRLAIWIRLVDNATGTEFRIVNTHLDNESQIAREQQAGLVVEDSCAYPKNYPQVLTGDMNCDARNPAIHVLKAGGWTDTYENVHGTEDPGFTYHEFLGPKCNSAPGKIDWIFVRGEVNVLEADVVRDSPAGRFPSDHYFVSATIVTTKP
jgi:endonuclease/exonuclease/phosphatase family metal-dependent hydrolase